MKEKIIKIYRAGATKASLIYKEYDLIYISIPRLSYEHIQKGKMTKHISPILCKILLQEKLQNKKIQKHRKADSQSVRGSVQEDANSGSKSLLEESTFVSRFSRGCNLFSTALLCKWISSQIIDKAALQAASSRNASVHLPSTKAFVLTFPEVTYLAESAEGKEEGRIRRCNHLGCLSSILG